MWCYGFVLNKISGFGIVGFGYAQNRWFRLRSTINFERSRNAVIERSRNAML